jgi:hypothetical protein
LESIAADHAAGIELSLGTPTGDAHVAALADAWTALVNFLAN